MRRIELHISNTALMREAAVWGYTIGENIGDDQSKLRHFVQGPTDKGHADLLRSAADDAWSEVLQVLSAYTVDGQCACGCGECGYRNDCGDGRGVDRVNEGDNGCYSVVLFFPDNTYPKIGRNIEKLCFRYLSLKMRGEWERLTRQDPSQAEGDAERVIRRLKVEASTRTTVGKTKGGWRYG